MSQTLNPEDAPLSQEGKRLGLAFASSDFPIGLIVLDGHQRLVSLSATALRLLGMETRPSEGAHLRTWPTLSSDVGEALMAALSGLSGPEQPSTLSFCTESPGQVAGLDWTATRIPANAEAAAHFVLTAQAHIASAGADGARQRMQALMNDLFDQSPIGEAYVSVEGEFLKVNQNLCTMLGYSEGELRGMDFQSVTYPADLTRDLMNVTDMLAGRIRTYSMEKRYVRKSGEVFWAKLTVAGLRDENQKIAYFISRLEDISPRKNLEQRYEREIAQLQDQLLLRQHEVSTMNARFERMALLDPVTGLLNAEGLEQDLQRAYALAHEDGEPFAVIDIRLHGYAAVASALGLDAGNALLRKAGDCLQQMVRRSDILGRRGGDNFVVALEQRALLGAGIQEISGRIHRALSATMEDATESPDIRVGLGVAELKLDETLEALLARASAASTASETPRC